MEPTQVGTFFYESYISSSSLDQLETGEEFDMDLSDATLAQVLIPVDDFEAGIAYYRDVLGLPLLFTAPPQMAFFACGGTRLLVGVLPPGQVARRGSALYFRVGDIQSVFSTLAERGVQFGSLPHLVNRTPRSELWLAEFADPDGNPLALLSEVPFSAAPRFATPSSE